MQITPLVVPHRVEIVHDLETKDVTASAHILTLGAVAIDVDNGHIVDRFSVKLMPLQPHRTISADTTAWWQSDAVSDVARQAALHNREQGIGIGDALCRYQAFIERYPSAGLWGNGSDFDNVILNHAFTQYGLKWPYHRNRCLRTLRGLLNAPRRAFPSHLTPHVAIDDAEAEALELVALLGQLAVLEPVLEEC